MLFWRPRAAARYLRENLETLCDRPGDAFEPVVLEDGSEHGPEGLAALRSCKTHSGIKTGVWSKMRRRGS